LEVPVDVAGAVSVDSAGAVSVPVVAVMAVPVSSTTAGASVVGAAWGAASSFFAQPTANMTAAVAAKPRTKNFFISLFSFFLRKRISPRKRNKNAAVGKSTRHSIRTRRPVNREGTASTPRPGRAIVGFGAATPGSSQRPKGVAGHVRGEGHLTEYHLDAALRQIRLALLEADVALPVVKEFTAHVKERAVGLRVTQLLSPAQEVTRIVRDELIALLGGQAADLSLDGKPAVIALVGLQGSGKTTSAAVT
jgi:signal recognition particle GTPase